MESISHLFSHGSQTCSEKLAASEGREEDEEDPDAQPCMHLVNYFV